MEYKEFEQRNIFGKGQENTGFAEYFSGMSYLNPLMEPGESSVFLANVTFEPGCRNNWHIHHADKNGGQILICVAGFGWYQEEGKPVRELKPGDVVVIPANVKHWHGAKKDELVKLFCNTYKEKFRQDHACILFSNGVIYPLDECGRI